MNHRQTSLQASLTRLGGKDELVLRDGIRILAEYARGRKPHPLALSEQPFDSVLLTESKLYRKSRQVFLNNGGFFTATLVSSPRTLNSSILLTPEIEYTPIERELIWSATDSVESRSSSSLKTLLKTRSLCTSIFHEQSHRLLWDLIPPPSTKRSEVTRYLNFMEALVVALDMALGDELTHAVSRVFYLSGVTYDPGTMILREKLTRRQYRNYLHACLYATYLKLSFYDPEDISTLCKALFFQDLGISERAIQRALRLDDDFVQITNPNWQKKHFSEFVGKMSKSEALALILPEDPRKNHLPYLWAERWFETMGL